MVTSKPYSTSRVTSNSPSTRQAWIGSDGLFAPHSLAVTYRTCSCSLWVDGTSRPIGKRKTFRDRWLRQFEGWNDVRRIDRADRLAPLQSSRRQRVIARTSRARLLAYVRHSTTLLHKVGRQDATKGG